MRKIKEVFILEQNQYFGGDWTAEKLERVKKYLQAYVRIMNKQNFRFLYIDAFAGTGYVELKDKQEDQIASLLLDLAEAEPQRFIQGSAQIALQIEPSFHKYVLIEKSSRRCSELEKLKNNYPHLAKRIVIINREANEVIREICKRINWRGTRAVMFLDPYGMQVRWDTIEAIARTKAIDLWLLFPLGVAVNRMLKNDGNINESWAEKLDTLFGTRDWYGEFYELTDKPSLFGNISIIEKVATIQDIGNYFIKRLKTVFAGVAENPLPLYNSKNNPLFLLCFAAGNPKGAPIAIRIAQDILRKR
ncbi:MAG: three-Cys-motif partner protein TcmP [Firmicutes bacterium]|nr:three-Cys-motif partner protein TcmP [Bacillota bacterium]